MAVICENKCDLIRDHSSIKWAPEGGYILAYVWWHIDWRDGLGDDYVGNIYSMTLVFFAKRNRLG